MQLKKDMFGLHRFCGQVTPTYIEKTDDERVDDNQPDILFFHSCHGMLTCMISL